jgi:hypothetical protein
MDGIDELTSTAEERATNLCMAPRTCEQKKQRYMLSFRFWESLAMSAIAWMIMTRYHSIKTYCILITVDMQSITISLQGRGGADYISVK